MLLTGNIYITVFLFICAYFPFFFVLGIVSLIISYFYKIILKKPEMNYLATVVAGLLIPSFLITLGALLVIIFSSLHIFSNYRTGDILNFILIPLGFFIYYGFWIYKIIKTKKFFPKELIRFSLAIYSPPIIISKYFEVIHLFYKI